MTVVVFTCPCPNDITDSFSSGIDLDSACLLSSVMGSVPGLSISIIGLTQDVSINIRE